MLLERESPRKYTETQYKEWTIRTSTNQCIVFGKSSVFKFTCENHNDAVKKAKELIAPLENINPTSKMFKTSMAANCNALFFHMMYGKVGAITGIELFLEGGVTKARVLRKDAFKEVQSKQIRSGGCCNLTTKKVIDGAAASLKITIPKTLADEVNIATFTRYELTPLGEDSRGLIYAVVRHSVVDRENPWSSQITMKKPGFTTYG